MPFTPLYKPLQALISLRRVTGVHLHNMPHCQKNQFDDFKPEVDHDEEKVILLKFEVDDFKVQVIVFQFGVGYVELQVI